jgi:lysophospholipase L1-like esterase
MTELLTSLFYMNMNQKIIALGDSIIKGVVLNVEETGKMHYALSDHNILQQVATALRLEEVNLGKMGCTIDVGERILDRHLSTIQDAKYVLLCFGGNDSDYDWRAIATNPRGEHYPKTPIGLFEKTYARIIDKVRKQGFVPLVMSLPGIDAQRYYNFFTSVFSDEEKRNVVRWLKNGADAIQTGYELYNDAVRRVAAAAGAQLLDVSGVYDNLEKCLCVDGIHPNHNGESRIAQKIKDVLK